VIDSSGIRFYYTTQEPRYRAGILALGALVDTAMIIPPRAKQFTISAVCTASCTDDVSSAKK